MSRLVCTFASWSVLILAQTGCSQPYRPMKALMIVGGVYHDYAKLPLQLADRLTLRGDVQVEVADDLAGINAKKLEPYQVLIFNDCQRPPLTDEFKSAVVNHVKSGKGLAVMHCSLWSYADWPEWTTIMGGRVETHDKYQTYDVVVLDPAHATMSGLGSRFTITDEPYLVDQRDPDNIVLIETARVHHDAKGQLRSGPDPQAWVRTYGKGRVFVTTFGHDAKSQESESFMTLLHNGVRWAGRVTKDTEHNRLTKPEQQVGYKLLFNGRDLAGWKPNANWKVENGELVGRATGLKTDDFLVHEQGFESFVLRASVRLVKGNSGIQFRSVTSPPNDPRPLHGYQAEILAGQWGRLIDYGGPVKFLPNLAGATQSASIVVEDGWNDIEIHAIGPQITILTNGNTTARYRQTDATGRGQLLALQLHHGEDCEVRVRDFRIGPPPRNPPESPASLP